MEIIDGDHADETFWPLVSRLPQLEFLNVTRLPSDKLALFAGFTGHLKKLTLARMHYTPVDAALIQKAKQAMSKTVDKVVIDHKKPAFFEAEQWTLAETKGGEVV